MIVKQRPPSSTRLPPAFAGAGFSRQLSSPPRALAWEAAGLAAIVRYLPSKSAEENERAMLEALEAVATGEVTVASRDAELNGVSVRKGGYLGLADGDAVAAGESFDEVAGAVVERLLASGRETLTLLTGSDGPDLGSLLELLQQQHPDVELDVQDGGQPHYPLLLAAE